MEERLDRREAGNRDRLAQKGFQAVLENQVPEERA